MDDTAQNKMLWEFHSGDGEVCLGEDSPFRWGWHCKQKISMKSTGGPGLQPTQVLCDGRMWAIRKGSG